MSKLIKIITLSIIGGLVGFITWTAMYFANKTPSIDFDGPAGAIMIASTMIGCIIFGLTGLILVLLRKS